MTQEVYKKWRRWAEYPLKDSDLIVELSRLEKDKKHFEEEITDRFYKDLKFGTGGLRGIMGVGSNRINIYTVIRATRGYVEYLKESEGNAVAIAYDSRMKSSLFAKAAATVFASQGIRVYIFSEMMPTPILSFAVRYLKCDGGIVVTASHNPAAYNGYKIYDNSGGQITDIAAETIWEKIQLIDIFENSEDLEWEDEKVNEMVSYIGDDVLQEYLKVVSKEAFKINRDKNIAIVYTPLNGTGLRWVPEVLKNNGFINIELVDEQCEPDGNFSTCRTPNPEKREALQLGIKYAKRMGADIVLATDPDCDRAGIAIKVDNGYRVFSGNEIGILLFDYICQMRNQIGIMPEKPICIKTIVTTDLTYAIGEYYGVEIRDVLTGFKYIGEQIGCLENNNEEKRFIFAMEESHGYLSGTYVRDKDGVNASLLICEMVDYYKSRGKNLKIALENLYQRFGYCLNRQFSYQFEGKVGRQYMKYVMKCIRADMEKKPDVMTKKMLKFYDYKKGLVYFSDSLVKETNLPKSDVCKIVWETGISIVVRPSGTEPKLKVYLTVTGILRKNVEEKERILTELIENYIDKKSKRAVLDHN